MNNYDKLYLYSQNLSILIVEDYRPLKDDLVETFENFFDMVASAKDGEEGVLAYKNFYKKHNKHFDIVISDIEMPNKNGVDMSFEIREINPSQNIIILSAYSDKDYLIPFINIGISMFIPKPIDKNILFGELHKLSMKISMQTKEDNNTHLIRLDNDFSWDFNKYILLKGGNSIYLTKHEKIILELFINKRNSISTNDDIVYAFYLYEYDIVKKNIRNYVFNLRKKLPSTMIETLYGMGYRLNIASTAMAKQ